MKKGLIFVLFALVAVVSYSQVSWNAKVGMNMSNFTGDVKDSKMKIGYNVGVGMEYEFSDMWSIQPSLMFSTKGTKLTTSTSEDVIEYETTYNPMYIELPVMAAARFAIADNQNIVVKAGPYLAYGIGGKVKVEGEDGGDFFGDGEGKIGGKRFDAGLGVGVAYEISKFFVSLDGTYGLTNVLEYKDESAKNINFSIGVGYKF